MNYSALAAAEAFPLVAADRKEASRASGENHLNVDHRTGTDSCLILTADGELISKRLYCDELPLDEIGDDEFLATYWLVDNGARVIREAYGPDADMVGPSSANIRCPKCGDFCARSVII